MYTFVLKTTGYVYEASPTLTQESMQTASTQASAVNGSGLIANSQPIHEYTSRYEVALQGQ